jgi:prepilin-type N-terminal cleavage/methylation domain-containing protein/prepilin-type processing-associated H-X9-DG protein
MSTRTHFNFSRPSAFTLIEMLVTISIIALLVSILLPALRNAREASQQVQCGSNLRQIQIAHATYTADNREIIIPAEIYGLAGNAWATTGWITVDTTVTFGLNNGKYFAGRYPRLTRCPNSPTEPVTLAVPTQYMVNRNISTNQINHPTVLGKKVVRMTEVKRQHSKVISITDAGRDGSTTVTLYSWYPYGGAGLVVPANFYEDYRVMNVGYWHPSDSANIAALDGHVTTAQITDAVPSSPAALSWWQNYDRTGYSFAK